MRFLCLIPIVLAACAGEQEPVVRQFGGPTMGSSYQVKFVGAVAEAAVRAVVEEELAAFDAAFSNWRADSEIVRLNAHASVQPFPVSARFAAVLKLALDVAAATDGAFDPTVKPLSDLYRAKKKDPRAVLDAAALAVAKERVGYRRVRLADGAVVKERSDLQLDLDGLVAGAAADAIAARLAPLRLRGLYLEITGEVLVRGDKGEGQPWRVGVVDPAADVGGGDRALVALPLRDRALCTSGDYRNAIVVDGRIVHHVFDPRTGDNPTHQMVSASVLADSAAVADAFGTACLVLGEARVQQLWPSWSGFALHGALLLTAGSEQALQRTEITWPKEDS